MPHSPFELGSLLWFLPLTFLVILVVLWRMWRRSRAIGAATTGLIVIAIAIYTFVKSLSPAGAYSGINQIEPMCAEKDHFMRFAGGSVEDFECGKVIHYGSYHKTADGWVVVHATSDPFTWKLKFSVFGFKMISENGETAYFPRRLVPFARPSWMPDWIQ